MQLSSVSVKDGSDFIGRREYTNDQKKVLELACGTISAKTLKSFDGTTYKN